MGGKTEKKFMSYEVDFYEYCWKQIAENKRCFNIKSSVQQFLRS